MGDGQEHRRVPLLREHHALADLPTLALLREHHALADLPTLACPLPAGSNISKDPHTLPAHFRRCRALNPIVPLPLLA